MTAPTEPETVVKIVSSLTASLLAANPTGDIVHAEANGSCWLGGNACPMGNGCARHAEHFFFLPPLPATALAAVYVYIFRFEVDQMN